MKKIGILFMLAVALTACYDDYVNDYEGGTAVSFPYQVNVRSFVVGEGMKIEVGAALGGVMENKINRTVNFALDNSLITPAILSQMKNHSMNYIKNNMGPTLEAAPSNLYSLSDNSKMIIKKGFHGGTVVVKADSVAFINATKETPLVKYALPFKITSCNDVDSINQAKNYAVIGLRYEAMLFGNWTRGGVAITKDKSGNTLKSERYARAVNQAETMIGVLETISPYTVSYNKYGNYTNIFNETSGDFTITLHNDNSITVGQAQKGTLDFQNDGPSMLLPGKKLQDRTICLSYKYTAGENTVFCKDTLFFRNRLRDGVNEWQDENPDHYN